MRMLAPRSFLLWAAGSKSFKAGAPFSYTPSERLSQQIPRLECYTDEIVMHASILESKCDGKCEDPFYECWSATSWTVNPNDDDQISWILQYFNSPAPQAYHALQRSLNLTQEGGNKAQMEVLKVFSYLLKRGYTFVIDDKNRKCSDLNWSISPVNEVPVGWSVVKGLDEFQNTLEIAHFVLDMTTIASKTHQAVDSSEIKDYVDLAIKRLEWTLGLDVRGRSSADAAFCFALSGITNETLYKMLATTARYELQRVGARPAFPSKYILQIVERLAAAGLHGSEVENVYKVAARYLELKDEHENITKALVGSPTVSFGLHSDRPKLWLWRFAARQTKTWALSKPKDEKQLSKSWIDDLKDPCLPLIVDVGSGMGVSLLGLAGSKERILTHYDAFPSVRYSECNLVGADLNQLFVGYSRGVTERLQFDHRLQFVCQSAECLMRDLQLYPGPVALIMVQFPTPFRLPRIAGGDRCGNSQLPADSLNGFMASPDFFRVAGDVLNGSKGCLLLQSNCEDVAIAMQQMAMQELVCLDAPYPVTEVAKGDVQSIPLRTQTWVEQGGERAVGPFWSSRPLLPRSGQTETEVACEVQGTPVHRCLLGSTVD